jgi:putative addiction module component (TIGR02574 family)
MMTLEQIRAEAMALPEEDRVALAGELMQCELSPAELADIEQAWLEEAERRLADMRAGRTQPVPNEEAVRKIRQFINR